MNVQLARQDILSIQVTCIIIRHNYFVGVVSSAVLGLGCKRRNSCMSTWSNHGALANSFRQSHIIIQSESPLHEYARHLIR
jgi:hypothetical protein